jgi:hypothetical protein
LSIVIDPGAPRRAPSRSNCLDYLLAALRTVCVRAETLFGELVEHRQDLKPPPARETVAHEVHAPALIGAHRRRQRHAHMRGPLGTFLGGHLQAFFAVQTVHALGVDLPALPAATTPSNAGRMVKKSAPIENRKDLESPDGGVNLTLRIGLHVS